MAFPDVTTILDDWNRSNVNPVDGDWSGQVRAALNLPHQIVNQRLTDTSRTDHETYYTGSSFSGKMQFYFTAVDRNKQGIGLVVTSTVGSSADGYLVIQNGQSGGETFRVDNDTSFTQIDTWSGTAFGNNDKLGAEFDDAGGTITITAYADEGSGWGSYSSTTDSTYAGSTFYAWIRTDSDTGFLIELDNFSGGELSTGSTVAPAALSMTLSVVDPTAIRGSIAKTPDALSMTLSVVDPTAIRGSITATPVALSMTLSVAAPSVAISATISPATLSITLSVVDPTVTLSAATINPATLSITLSVVDPVVSATEPPPITIVEVDPDACFEASYQVKVYDWHSAGGGLVGLYDLTGSTVVSLRYKRNLNSLGTFQITVPLNAANELALGVFDRIVEIERYRSPGGTADVELTGMVRHVHRFTDEDDLPWLIVGGYSLEHLLTRRVINPVDDPAASGGYSTKSAAADTVMVALVDEQAGPSASLARRTPGLSVPAAVGTGQTVGGRWRYDNLLEVLMSLTKPGRIDFRIVRTSAATLTFLAEVIGQDRTRTANYPGSPFLLFKPELGNLVEPSLSVDRRNEATYIYLLGQGPEEDREVYENQSSRLLDTPYNRVELAEDARSVEDGDTTQFLTQGLKVLDDRRPQLDFEYEVAQTSADYRVRWDLGDKVTLEWGTYRTDARITEVEVEVTTEERIEPTLELL